MSEQGKKHAELEAALVLRSTLASELNAAEAKVDTIRDEIEALSCDAERWIILSDRITDSCPTDREKKASERIIWDGRIWLSGREARAQIKEQTDIFTRTAPHTDPDFVRRTNLRAVRIMIASEYLKPPTEIKP